MVLKTEKVLYPLPMRVRFRGKYDYDGLLSLIRGFYKRTRFRLKEPKLKYKQKQNGAEVEFKFVAEREVTHYIRIFLTVTGHMWDVKRDDKGYSDGKVEITINAKYVLNYAKTFKSDRALERWMQLKLDSENVGLQFADNKVSGKKYLEKITVQLQTEIKKHLKMECV